MKKEELYKMPKWAGIYYFRNTINNKYFIGKSFTIRKSVLKHLSDSNKIDTPLYRDLKKYSLEAFEVGVLEDFKKGYTKEELRDRLDEREEYYIKCFNAYGKTGYNQTKGGKTVVEKEVVEEVVVKCPVGRRGRYYTYDLKENCYYVGEPGPFICRLLRVDEATVRSPKRKVRCGGRFIISGKEEDLKIKGE